jgi:hypothetical protein
MLETKEIQRMRTPSMDRELFAVRQPNPWPVYLNHPDVSIRDRNARNEHFLSRLWIRSFNCKCNAAESVVPDIAKRFPIGKVRYALRR